MEILISNKTLQIEQPGVSPICGEEEIVNEHHAIAKPRSPNGWCAPGIKVIRHYRNDHGQIKIAVEPPRKIEIALVSESGEGCCGNTARNARPEASCGEDRIVRNKSATREQGRSRLWGGALRSGYRSTEQREERQDYTRKLPNEIWISYSHKCFLQQKRACRSTPMLQVGSR